MADRLLFLVPAIKDPAETGGELFNLNLSRGLAAEWNLSVATFDDIGLKERAEGAYRDAVARYMEKQENFDAIVQDTYVFPFCREANRVLSQTAPLIGFGQAVYSERFRRPWSRWIQDRRMSAGYRTYAGLIVVSDAMREHADKVGVATSKIRVVPPGFALRDAPLAVVDRPRNPVRLVTAGSYQPSKGQHLIVEGLALFVANRPEYAERIVLEMHGNQGYAPDYVAGLRQLVSDKRLNDSVVIDGPLRQRELWELFSRSHLFCFVAQGEGFGMVTLESMLCGCVPLLCEDSLSRSLTGGAVGQLVAPDARSVAEGLERLIERFGDWDNESAASQRRAMTVALSWEETIERFSRSIRELASLPLT
jgi:glycosyltransferase involved in cell wall biosynthesis